jgi:hypothetical protein
MHPQSVLLLKNEEGTCPASSKLKCSLFNFREMYSPGFIGPAKEESDGIGLNEHLTDFVSKDHHDDKHGNGAETLEKPAG